MADYDIARGVYDQLVQRGVHPSVATGAVASLMGESGKALDPTSYNPGDGADGSDSIGFGQWNSTRAEALRRKAAEMGTDWKDPRAQVNHLGSELDTSHNHVLSRLLNAKTAEDGVNIWTTKYEVPAGAQDRARERMAHLPIAAQRLGVDLTGGAGPVVNPNPNLPPPIEVKPAPGQTLPAPTQDDLDGSGMPGINRPPSAPNVPARPGAPGAVAGPVTPPSMWDSVLKGGPGALFGAPQKDWNLGESLLGVGASLSSISNPAQAAVLAGQLKAMQEARYRMAALNAKTATDTTVDSQYDPKKGQMIIKNPDGTGRAVGVAGIREDPKTMTEQARKNFVDYSTKADLASELLAKGREFRSLLADGKIDVSLMAQGGAKLREAADRGDEVARNTGRYQQWILDMRDRKLMDATGVQTDADAVRALEGINPGTGKYDNGRTLDAIDTVMGDTRKAFERHASNVKSMATTYKGDEGTFNERLSRWEEAKKAHDDDDAVFKPKRERFNENRKFAAENPWFDPKTQAGSQTNPLRLGRDFKDGDAPPPKGTWVFIPGRGVAQIK